MNHNGNQIEARLWDAADELRGTVRTWVPGEEALRELLEMVRRIG